MSAFGIAIVWCAIQVTIVSLIAIAADMLLKRRGRVGGSNILLVGLTGAILLTVFVWSPWPRWSWETAVAESSASNESTTDNDAESASRATDSIAASVDAPAETRASTSTNAEPVTESAWSLSAMTTSAGDLWQAWQSELSQSKIVVEQTASAPSWPVWVGILIVCGIGVSTIRLILGWNTIQRDRRNSRVISSPQLAELCDLLRAELSITSPVEVRESPHMATAATIGWTKPLILLPLDWRTWEAAELRAVLAHELGHISRRHFPAWLMAQIALALHFYHPCVHWIVGRLRLAQELEADEDAALVNGGRRSYLESLAALAIRQADAPVSWPARAFLPTRKTFMRRIEMLRSNRPLRAPSAVMTFIACGLVLAGVTFAAGVRDGQLADDSNSLGAVEQLAVAQPNANLQLPRGQAQPQGAGGSASTAAADTSGPITLSHIPGDAVVVAAIRPSKLMQSLEGNEDFAPVLAMFAGEDPMVALFTRAEQVTVTMSGASINPPSHDPPFAVTIQFATPADLEAFWEQTKAEEERAFANSSYRAGSGPECFWPLDDRTVMIGREEIVQQSILRGARVRSDLVSSGIWETSAASAHALVAVDVEFFAGLLPQDMMSAVMATFSPIWEESETLTVALTMEGSSLNAVATLDCDSEEGAVTVQETLQAVVVLARNALAGYQRQMARPGAFGPVGPGGPPQEQMGTMMSQIFAMQEVFFDSLTLTAEGSTVTLTSAYEIDPALFAMFAQGVKGARAAAQDMQMQNNLKQIGLALHNYHDVHGHFPPAVITDPASGETHSWRIEILPYVEQAPLYNSYRMNEPWDSDHNKQILAQMPPVFAPLGQSAEATPMENHTGVLAIVGERTGFAAEGEGLRIQDFTDGTSNTLLVVDSPGELVPWTKPDDLEVILTGDEIDLGGLEGTEFQTLFCDGSVRTMPPLDQQSLIIFMGRDDGIPTPITYAEFPGGTTETFLVPTTQYGFGEAEIGAFPVPQFAEPTATEAIPVPVDEAIPVPPEGLQPPASPRPPQPQ